MVKAVFLLPFSPVILLLTGVREEDLHFSFTAVSLLSRGRHLDLSWLI